MVPIYEKWTLKIHEQRLATSIVASERVVTAFILLLFTQTYHERFSSKSIYQWKLFGDFTQIILLGMFSHEKHQATTILQDGARHTSSHIWNLIQLTMWKKNSFRDDDPCGNFQCMGLNWRTWTHHKQQASVWDEPKLWSECSDYIYIGGNKDMSVAHDFQDIWCLAPLSGKVIVNCPTSIRIMFNQSSHLPICLQSFNQSPLSHPMNHQEETSVHLVEYPWLRLKCKFLINVWLLPNPSVISLVPDTIGPQHPHLSTIELWSKTVAWLWNVAFG